MEYTTEVFVGARDGVCVKLHEAPVWPTPVNSYISQPFMKSYQGGGVIRIIDVNKRTLSQTRIRLLVAEK